MHELRLSATQPYKKCAAVVGEDEDGVAEAHDARPVELGVVAEVLREGDAGPAVKHGLADGRDGAGVIDVGAEIAAGIDAAEHPARLGHDTMTVKRSAAFTRESRSKATELDR